MDSSDDRYELGHSRLRSGFKLRYKLISQKVNISDAKTELNAKL
jgi:hypothetical protein